MTGRLPYLVIPHAFNRVGVVTQRQGDGFWVRHILDGVECWVPGDAYVVVSSYPVGGIDPLDLVDDDENV